MKIKIGKKIKMERIGEREREQRVLGNFLGVCETILIYEIY